MIAFCGRSNKKIPDVVIYLFCILIGQYTMEGFGSYLVPNQWYIYKGEAEVLISGGFQFEIKFLAKKKAIFWYVFAKSYVDPAAFRGAMARALGSRDGGSGFKSWYQ